MPFKPGQSGNPNGRPKAHTDMVEFARSKTKVNLERIITLAESAEDENVRLRASQILHEIAWGKPVQQQQITGESGGPIVISWMAPA